MSDKEHAISIRSVQVWSGCFNADFLDEDGNRRKLANDLDFQEEKSLSFECSCGKRFLKWHTAEEHLQETSNSVAQG